MSRICILPVTTWFQSDLLNVYATDDLDSAAAETLDFVWVDEETDF